MKVKPISLLDLNGNWRASEPKTVKHSGVKFNTIVFNHIHTNTRFYVNDEESDITPTVFLYHNQQEYKLIDTKSSILLMLQRALTKLNVDFKPLNYKSIVERLGGIRYGIELSFTSNTLDSNKLQAINTLEQIDRLIAQIIMENKNSDEWRLD